MQIPQYSQMESVRPRFVFEDRNVLSKSQKKQGLERSWILLKPQRQTIFDLSSHLLHIFHLHKSCPHGRILSMVGFVLPPFESTYIFQDKDIISVKKKGGKPTEIIKAGGDLNSLEELQIAEQSPANTGVKLLANKEFDKETGRCESEPEEDEQKPEQLENQAQGESTPIERKERHGINFLALADQAPRVLNSYKPTNCEKWRVVREQSKALQLYFLKNRS